MRYSLRRWPIHAGHRTKKPIHELQPTIGSIHGMHPTKRPIYEKKPTK